MTNWSDAEYVFRKSYDEVLAAIKHQDDKLGRVLTVLAFLTGGGVSLWGAVHKDPAPIVPSLWSYLLVAFLGSVALAVVLAIAGVDPTSLVPDRAAAASAPPLFPSGDTGVSTAKSLVFYEQIAKDEHWDSYIAPEQHDLLKEALARNLHRDARVLSHRVVHKIERSNESQAFLQVAVVCLVLFGLFAVSTDASAGYWSSVAFLTLVTLVPLWSVLWMKIDHFPGATHVAALTPLLFVAFSGLIAADLTVARLTHHEVRGLAIALGLFLLSRLANPWAVRLARR